MTEFTEISLMQRYQYDLEVLRNFNKKSSIIIFDPDLALAKQWIQRFDKVNRWQQQIIRVFQMSRKGKRTTLIPFIVQMRK